MQFSPKIMPNDKLAAPPLGMAPTPPENPGSATEQYWQMQINSL